MSNGRARPETSGTAESDPEAPLDSALFFQLIRVVNLTARPFQAAVGRRHQLTLNEWRVMVVLAAHAGIAATEVADRTGLDKMTVSRALAGLQRRGRLQRRSDAADQRKSRLFLTAEGRRLYALVAASARQREAQLFAGLSAADLHHLGATLARLAAASLASEASWDAARTR